MADTSPRVDALHRCDSHSFTKESAEKLFFVPGVGVDGDAHAGPTVKHRSRVAVDPSQPNLRQVHLIPGELLDELHSLGHDVNPGDLGENVTTRGIDLQSLAAGTSLRLGDDVLLVVTGLRNPCHQIEAFQAGLLKCVLSRQDNQTIRKAGVMAIVVSAGIVSVGDGILAAAPPGLPKPLECV